jgi:hypothetical protein
MVEPTLSCKPLQPFLLSSSSQYIDVLDVSCRINGAHRQQVESAQRDVNREQVESMARTAT